MMNQKQAYIYKPVNSAEMPGYGKNGDSKSTSLSKGEAEGEELQKMDANSRLEEMEERNASLENLIVQNTTKLAEVVESNRKFVSIIGHDLRGPLCTIFSVLEMLKDGLGEYNIQDMTRYLAMATNSANKTISLLDNLLTWSATQNIEKNYNPVRINLSELIDEEIENEFISATQKQIVIFNSINPDFRVVADNQMLRSVIRNLISNAIKFSNPGGEVTLSATEQQKFVEIQVEDNGTGISEEDQKALFIPDIRHSTPGTKNEQGTGLGLIICKEFIERHGGSIVVESESGKGSIFKFTLPHYI